MQKLMIFEGHEVEAFEFEGRVLFNPYHVGECLDLAESSVRNYLAKMNKKQAVSLKNSDVRDKDIRKLNNAGEKFLTESGVYKLAFKSHKPNAEAFADWVVDEVLPALRKTGSYNLRGEEKAFPQPCNDLMVISNGDEKVLAYNRGIVLGVFRHELEEDSTLEIFERLSVRGKGIVMKMIFGDVS